MINDFILLMAFATIGKAAASLLPAVIGWGAKQVGSGSIGGKVLHTINNIVNPDSELGPPPNGSIA